MPAGRREPRRAVWLDPRRAHATVPTRRIRMSADQFSHLVSEAEADKLDGMDVP